MSCKNRNFTNQCTRSFLIIVIISLFLIPIIFGKDSINPTLSNYELSPIPSGISKDDYTPILSEEKYSLGNITVNDIDLSKLEMGFFLKNVTYPLLKNDYDTGAFNISRTAFSFIETASPAIQDNLNENIIDSNIITVKLNETLEVSYNNPQAGYLVYLSRLRPSRLEAFYVNNGTDIIKLEETDFIFDSNNFLLFYYRSYFGKGPIFNFEMYLIWEYDLAVQSWDMIQYPFQDLLINDIEQNFTVKFQYNFNLLGRKYGQTLQENNVAADNIELALTLNLPDKDYLEDHALMLNNKLVGIGTHLNPDNSIDILLSDHFLANNSIAMVNFTSQFTFKFEDPVNKSWAIDRLVSMRNIRERIYLPSIIAGPKHIYIKGLSFFEFTFLNNTVLSSSSQFERETQFSYLNASLTGKEGIEIMFPYLIKGETCPCTINYISDQILRVAVTDNIKMPLVGARIDIFYYGVEYGTYISNENIQPIPAGNTNENGEIILFNVPYGNYTIRVYFNGIFIKESIASTLNSINYIYTNYPHFPIWLLIFGLINGVIILFGIIFYLKKKKIR